jgi:hypothetical protein
MATRKIGKKKGGKSPAPSKSAPSKASRPAKPARSHGRGGGGSKQLHPLFTQGMSIGSAGVVGYAQGEGYELPDMGLPVSGNLTFGAGSLLLVPWLIGALFGKKAERLAERYFSPLALGVACVGAAETAGGADDDEEQPEEQQPQQLPSPSEQPVAAVKGGGWGPAMSDVVAAVDDQPSSVGAGGWQDVP